MSIDTVLAIIGLLLAVLLYRPIDAYLTQRYRTWRLRRGWSADSHVDRGEIQLLPHYGLEYWRQLIEVDDSGGARHTVDARIVNLSSKLLEKLWFPVYADAANVPASAVSPWAKTGRTAIDASVENWDPERARGLVAVKLRPAMKPGEVRRLRWGYQLPTTFRPGDEYYNYDVSNPFHELALEFRFSDAWSILYARWPSSIGDSQPPPAIDDRRIKWTVRFPGLGQRITILIGLATNAPHQ